jgi:hypothetical protein
LTDAAYSVDSKYAFPLLSGVQHSARTTFDMMYSAWPTSSEFSAIHWMEGRAIQGGCPAGKTCTAASRPEPILIAYFDFDNDGFVDTVIKFGAFFPGYARMSWAEEGLIVWRGQKLKIGNMANLWDLEHPADKGLTPLIEWYSVYIRPFIYRGVTYVASYEPSFSEEASNSLNRYMPPYPIREDMFVEKYSFTGRTEAVTGRPQWTTDTICDFGMKRLKN